MTTQAREGGGGIQWVGLGKGVVRDVGGFSTSSSSLLGFSLKLRSWPTDSNVPGSDVDDAGSL
jgi:hypothetical protein